jgi:DNA-binding response OmpR family regulator
MTTRILVIEDEAHIADFLKMGLTHEGFHVETAASVAQGLAAAEERRPDLVVLDLMLPDGDGFDACARLRSRRDLLILMLTARDALADRVKGLEMGADDYLVKPFHFEELLARIRALLRRHKAQASSKEIRVGNLSLDPETRIVRRGEREISLTAREFDLLRLLMSHPHRVYEREQLLDLVWGHEYERESNVVDVYIRRLREKVDRDGETALLHTVRSVGYVLRG